MGAGLWLTISQVQVPKIKHLSSILLPQMSLFIALTGLLFGLDARPVGATSINSVPEHHYNMTNDRTISLVFPEGQAKHAIIWLHGLGATSSDFPPVVPELGLDPDRPIHFVFPQAPDRPITINGGMQMPGWYDIKGASIEDKQDAEGMAESQAALEALIKQEVDAGIPSENIIIAGFSQGGAVVYHTGVRSQHKLAGMLTMSTYVPFVEKIDSERSEVNQSTPIFASHGTFDPMVPMTLGKVSVDELSKLGYNVKWQTYPMQHNVVLEQLKDIGQWINSVFEP